MMSTPTTSPKRLYWLEGEVERVLKVGVEGANEGEGVGAGRLLIEGFLLWWCYVCHDFLPVLLLSLYPLPAWVIDHEATRKLYEGK